MTIMPHALIGATTATLAGNNYLLAFVFGVISHFLMDALPHLDPKFLLTKDVSGSKKWSNWIYAFILGEFTLTVFIFYFLRHRPDFNILLCGALGGIFPDLIVNNPLLEFLRRKPVIKYLFHFHDKIHLDIPDNFWYLNLIVEVLLIGGSLWYLQYPK
jgi:hypothetical protein